MHRQCHLDKAKDGEDLAESEALFNIGASASAIEAVGLGDGSAVPAASGQEGLLVLPTFGVGIQNRPNQDIVRAPHPRPCLSIVSSD